MRESAVAILVALSVVAEPMALKALKAAALQDMPACSAESGSGAGSEAGVEAEVEADVGADVGAVVGARAKTEVAVRIARTFSHNAATATASKAANRSAASASIRTKPPFRCPSTAATSGVGRMG